jgi:hypothetical protein
MAASCAYCVTKLQLVSLTPDNHEGFCIYQRHFHGRDEIFVFNCTGGEL